MGVTTNANAIPAALPSFMSAYDRIVGGKTATAPIPWQVALISFCSDIGCFVKCGGTVLDSTTILTAAHCKVKAGEIMAMVGQIHKDKGKRIQISKVINHNYTEKAEDNDIAIVKLATPLTLGKNIQAICLPSATFNPAVGATCFTSGWGNLKENGKEATNLQYVGVPMVSFKSCKATYGSTLTANYICAGFAAGGKDSCQGDSGGPLVCMEKGKPVITGVVSSGNGCARPKVPGVYTKVANYLTWIKANMGGSTSSPPASSTAKPTTATTAKPSSEATPPATTDGPGPEHEHEPEQK